MECMGEQVLNINDPDWHDRSVDTDVEVQIEDLDGRPIRVVRAHLAGRALREGKQVQFSGRTRSTLELRCGRCLEPFAFEVDAPFALKLVAEPFAELSDEGEVDAARVDDSLFYAEEGRADLGAIAREQLYLGLPLKPICREGCAGLCPTCGENRNRVECGCSDEGIDPRLAPLLRFRKPRGDA